MKEKIKIIYGSNEEGSIVILNKLDIMKLLLELLETKEVETIEVNYKKQTPKVEVCSKN